MVSPRKTSENNPIKSAESLIYQTGVRMLKGGFSGLVSGGLLQPLQVIKTSMQVSPVTAEKYLDEVKSIQEGQ